jgi:hypothetical protein
MAGLRFKAPYIYHKSYGESHAGFLRHSGYDRNSSV